MTRFFQILVLPVLLIAYEVGASEASQSGEVAYAAGDYARAYKELAPLADIGDADAQYVLGLMYASGYGVEQNFYNAGRMYRQAGEQGHVGAQVNLGSLLENCRGIGSCKREDAAAILLQRDQEEFYDLENDPNEINMLNLASLSETEVENYRALSAKLNEMLEQ